MSKWADLPRWDGRSPALRAKQNAMVRRARVEQANAEAVAEPCPELPAKPKPFVVVQGELDLVARADRAAALSLPAFARPIFRDVATEYGVRLSEIVGVMHGRRLDPTATAARREAIVQSILARPDLDDAALAEALPFPSTVVRSAATEARKRACDGSDNLTGRSKALLAEMPEVAREIIREVAAAHRVTIQEILGVRKTDRIVAARNEAILRVREARPNWSLPQMGRVFRRDHTTILYSLNNSAAKDVRGAA